jgi:hypothetical protein
VECGKGWIAAEREIGRGAKANGVG